MVKTEIKIRKRCSTKKRKRSKRCSTSASELPDWAHLPELALHLISTKVKSITDYVRFRAVCSSWRSASSSKPCHLPPQLPWLMINDRRSMKKGIGLFYDLWESKMHKLYFPKTTHTPGMRPIHTPCIASCRGWLFLSSRRGGTVFLLNPLTRARIRLPHFINTKFNHRTVSKVTFSTDLTDPNCLIMVLYLGKRMIHFCRVGDPCWTEVVGGGFSFIYDVTYYNGRFYLLCEGYMEIVEPKKPEERIVYNFEPKIKYVRKRFLEGKSGVYVVAFRLNNIYEKKKPLETKIEFYQFQEQSLKLKQIPDTNDTAIFSGWDSFFLSVSSDDWDLVDYIGGSFINVRKSSTERCYHISTKLDNGKSNVVCYLNEGRHIELLTWFPFQPSFV